MTASATLSVLRQRGAELATIALSLLMALPLWLTRHPPIQDWPQHLAAVRVLHSYSDPAFGLEAFFSLTPADTQYLTVYYLAHGLAYLFGITAALKLVLSISIVALPLAISSLSKALGRSGSAALLAIPLAYTAHTVLGFLNFVAALPLLMVILTLAVRQRASPKPSRIWLMAGLLALCFYTHVVPFALALFGALLVMVEAKRSSLRRLLPLLVVALIALPWFALSPSGQSVLAALGLRHSSEKAPEFTAFTQSWQQMPLWLTDVWRSSWDVWQLRIWLSLALTWVVAGLLRRTSEVEAPVAAARWLLVLPPLCLVAYFVLPASYGWIWPINTRFLLLGLLLAIPLLRDVPGLARHAFAATAVVLSLVSVVYVSRAFTAYEQEVGDLPGAIERIPPRAKVAGLIWSRGSRVVEFSPFLHSVAYYQAARGGAVMFTFADFPQSPFHFLERDRPPRAGPRWEWKPEQVVPDRDLGWYDWLLTRGGPKQLAGASEFSLVFSSPPWRVYQRAVPRQAE